jgi:hypothetical protein
MVRLQRRERRALVDEQLRHLAAGAGAGAFDGGVEVFGTVVVGCEFVVFDVDNVVKAERRIGSLVMGMGRLRRIKR